MKNKLLGFILVFNLLFITGCEESDLTPEQLKQLNQLAELKKLEQQEDVQKKINEITERIKTLQAEEKNEVEDETENQDKTTSKKDEVKSNENSELQELMKQLEKLRNKIKNTNTSSDLTDTDDEESTDGNSDKDEDTDPIATTSSNCNFLGGTLAHEQSKTYYKAPSVPHGSTCQSETRSCNNGVMTGNVDYRYTTCTVASAPVAVAPSNCSLSGVTIAHGGSGFFYSADSVPFGSSCNTVRTERVCNNGTLSGDAAFTKINCTVEAAPVAANANCTLDGVTVNHGDSHKFYNTESVPALGMGCFMAKKIRTCNNGILSGSNDYKYANCSQRELVIPVSSSCTLDGVTVDHNASRKFYSKKSLAFGKNCNNYKQGRTCNNGTLSGDSQYKYANCSVSLIPGGGVIPDGGIIIPNDDILGEINSSCTLDGVTINDNSSKLFYSKKIVNPGQSCNNYRQGRTCNKGTLSGNDQYKYSSCSVGILSDDKVIPEGGVIIPDQGGIPILTNCSLDGVIINNGDNHFFYDTEEASPMFGIGGCNDHDLKRVCNNGTLSGSNAYKYANCVNTAFGIAEKEDCELDGITVNHNASHTFYSTSTASFPKHCTDYDLVRTCNDGTLSGSNSFNKNSCSNQVLIPGGVKQPTLPTGPVIPDAPVIPNIPIGGITPPIPVGPIPGGF